MRLHVMLAAAPIAAAFALAQPVQAQQEVAPSRVEAERGAPYAVGTFEDWEVRCIRGDDPGTDPCQMSQRLLSEDGSPTAEVNVFPVPDNPQIVAAATIVTPLETLLTRGVTFAIDGAGAGDFPFQFCNRQGCVAQLGFTADEVDTLKGGSEARLTIYPVAAPENAVNLTMSLAGFTAAFDAMVPLPGLQ